MYFRILIIFKNLPFAFVDVSLTAQDEPYVNFKKKNAVLFI